MFFETKKNQSINICNFSLKDTDLLLTYLHQLSDETRNRFNPHDANEVTITELYCNPSINLGYIAVDLNSHSIVAYTILQWGVMRKDQQRIKNYGISINTIRDASFAPSVADDWQGCGVGTALLKHIKSEVKKMGIHRLFLWGGVQSTNQKAISYYRKEGFSILGSFQHQGVNLDMMLLI